MNDQNKWHPASDVQNFNPLRYSFNWNKDYTQFQAVPLKWHDDASYIAYQGDNFEADGCEIISMEEAKRKIAENRCFYLVERGSERLDDDIFYEVEDTHFLCQSRE